MSSGGALYTSVATDAAGTPYIVYMDEDQGYKATVKKFSGGTWVTVGIAGFSAGRAEHTSIAISSAGIPYVAYMDQNVSYKATVMRFDGSAWVNVGTPGLSAGQAEYTCIAIDASGTPYVVYSDWGNAKKATVMRFSGSAWVNVGATGFSAGQASYTKLVMNSTGMPYVVYKDAGNSGKATVMRYTGTLWSTVGTAGFSAGQAEYTALAFANDTPFVAYSDWSMSRMVTAMKYNGTTWVAAGTPGLSPDRADNIAMATDTAGKPHILYADWYNGDEATVLRYNGSSWATVGAAIFSTGATSGNAIAISRGNTIYVGYTDGDVGGKATVIKYDEVMNPITGSLNVCSGYTSALGNADGGGTWSSSNTGIAMVGAASGVVTGVSSGTAIISYTTTGGCGALTTTVVVTVSAAGTPITGTLIACTGYTTTLSNATAGGTWSSSSATIGTIGSSSGIVTGITPGTTTISYIAPGGCNFAAVVTVSTTPAFITGPLSVCAGTTSTLSCVTPGGTWSSSNTAIGTIGSSSGTVMVGTVGTTSISYTMPGGCARNVVMTVNTNPPAITGVMQACVSSNTTLSDPMTGGIWSSSNTAIATVISSTGMVVGVTPGTVTISYYAIGCYATAVVTINAIPSPISGPSAVCAGSTGILSSIPSGGSWSSSNTSLATIDASGVITGIAVGNPIITYGFPTGCFRTLLYNVSAAPAPIAGLTTVCEGASVPLSSAPAGGTWVSSTSNASIGTSSGVVTGVTVGTSTITYSVGAGCRTTTTITVAPSPGVITGPGVACVGSTIALASSAGGSWTSANPGIATVGSASGVVMGVMPGAATITYSIPSGCYRVAIVTVIVTPAAAVISGPTAVCAGDAITLSASMTGGIWSSVTGRASVSAGTGMVAGMAGGPDTIFYSTLSACGVITASYPVTVNAIPSPGTIIGETDVCRGNTITLSSTIAGGTWRSGNVVVATISPAGVLTGIVAGTVTVMYRVSNLCGADTAFSVIEVHEHPDAGAITGLDTVCQGDTIRLANTATSGLWSSAGSETATIDADGLVTGVLPGIVTIRYITTNLCGADTATKKVYVQFGTICGTAVAPTASVTHISIFPNPSSGALTVETPAPGTLLVYTIDGKEVSRHTIRRPSTSVTLPGDLTAGLYMCRFAGEDGSSTVVRLVYQP
ncbi:hypothetical protein GCM10023093_01690 [Nemorincola caseinilytica]|uniref:BIG2 domain-containing protein n=2 Tax=Nemorincola caseinilytica TaxID=2054315 RepID=A0ABP8N684_9BACT